MHSLPAFLPRRRSACCALVVLLAAAPPAAAPPAAAQTPLRLGVPVADSLGAGREHVYTLDAAAGQFVAGDADGPDVDLVVRVVGPDGTEVGRFDTGPRGPEPFQFVTAAAGRYRIVALPFENGAGRYTVTLRRTEPVAAAGDANGRLSQVFASFGGPGQPAIGVAVIRDGAVAARIGAASDVRFDIGELGEALTATAALRLADAGVLDLDADVRTYLPGLPAPTGAVTVRDLLEHRTGYHDVAEVYALAGWTPDEPLTQAAADTVLARQPVLADPPRFRASGGRTDAVVLARVLEAAADASFAALMQETVFAPFGMADTVVRTAPGQPVVRAASRTALRVQEGYVAVAPSRDGTYGWGNVFSTIADLTRWAVALVTDRGLLDRMAPPGVDFRDSGAFGLQIDQGPGGGTRLSATGRVRGATSRVVIEPALRSGYVVLAAASGVTDRPGGLPIWELERLTFGERTRDGMGFVIGPPARPRSPAVPPGLVGLEPYHGRYVGATLGDTLTVQAFRENGLMAVGAEGEAYVFYVDRAGDSVQFVAARPLGTVWFEYDAAGWPAAIVLQNAGVQGLRYERAGG